MLSEHLANWLDDDPSLPPIFVQTVPETPDLVLCLFEGDAGPTDLPGWRTVTLQVRCRGGEDPRASHAVLELIHGKLDGLEDLDLPGGYALDSCLPLQDSPVYIGQDSRGRHEWTQNYVLEWVQGP